MAALTTPVAFRRRRAGSKLISREVSPGGRLAPLDDRFGFAEVKPLISSLEPVPRVVTARAGYPASR
jgi:hypothetical protein